jgi:hypothetical protein
LYRAVLLATRRFRPRAAALFRRGSPDAARLDASNRDVGFQRAKAHEERVGTRMRCADRHDAARRRDMAFSNAGRFDHFIRLSSPSTYLDLADEALRRIGRLAARMATHAP